MPAHDTASGCLCRPGSLPSMPRRRALRAVSVYLLLAISTTGLVAPARAQTDVEDAVEDVEAAYRIVDASIEERDAIEEELFAVLDRYTRSAEQLEELADQVAELESVLVVAEARIAAGEDQFEDRAVTAYMEAVSANATLLLDSRSVELAMVVSETLGRGSRESLAAIDDHLALTGEIVRLRSSALERRNAVETARVDLEAEAAELERLFGSANAAVAEAYAAAAAAERRLDLERAALATTTTSPPTEPTAPSTPTTAPPGSSSTTSTTTPVSTTSTSVTTTTPPPTTTPPEWPPIPLSAATLSWRPLIEAHFAPDLVLDALVIVQCESLGDPDAYNPNSGASGLFQFIPGTWAVASVRAGVGGQSVFDPEANVIAASWLAEYYRSRGSDPWRPWACRRLL